MCKKYNLIDSSIIYEMQEQLREIRSILSQNQKPVMLIEEAASFTGFSTSHLHKLSCTGGIPCYKKGKRLLFRREELESWLLSNRRATIEDIDALASNYVTLRKGGGK